MGDFERTFGAGFDAADIIDNFSREGRESYTNYKDNDKINSTKEFNSFQEASEWAKNNPGKAIKRNPMGLGFIEVKLPKANLTQFFVIQINPGSIEKTEYFKADTVSDMIEGMLESESPDFNEMERYAIDICAINGCASESYITDPPKLLPDMQKALLEHDWILYPVSAEVCLINNVAYGYQGCIEGILITYNKKTKLIAGLPLYKKMYAAITNQ